MSLAQLCELSLLSLAAKRPLRLGDRPACLLGYLPRAPSCNCAAEGSMWPKCGRSVHNDGLQRSLAPSESQRATETRRWLAFLKDTSKRAIVPGGVGAPGEAQTLVELDKDGAIYTYFQVQVRAGHGDASLTA